MSKALSCICDPYVDEGRRSDGFIRSFKRGGLVRGRRPRQWLYATKPLFARLKRPLAEALRAVEEVCLMLDLRSLCPRSICLEMKPSNSVLITATNNHVQFAREIPLPKNADVFMREGHFQNGILELVLTRKAGRARAHQQERGD